MSFSFKALIVLYFFGLFMGTAAYATDTDSQIWTSLTAIKTITPQIDTTVELHARFTEDADVLGQRLFRPSITYKFNDKLSATMGYFYGVFNTSKTFSFHEQRIWEQIGYTLFRTENGTQLSGRTRLEERFVEDRADTGWRLRQQLRFETPLIKDRLKGLVWNETFIGLNDTDWGQRADFDQTRTFLGFNIPVSKTFWIEPGYLNQLVFRDGEDRINHIFATNFYIRF